MRGYISRGRGRAYQWEGAHLSPLVKWPTGNAVNDTVLASVAVLALDTLLGKLLRFRFYLFIEDLYELGFCLARGEVDVMMVEHSAELGNGKSRRVEIRLEVFAELDDLCGREAARHDGREGVGSARNGERGGGKAEKDVVGVQVAARPVPTRHPRDKQTRAVRHISHVENTSRVEPWTRALDLDQ